MNHDTSNNDLASLNVPEMSDSLRDILQRNNCLCIIESETGWEVHEISHGKSAKIREFVEEEIAYQFASAYKNVTNNKH